MQILNPKHGPFQKLHLLEVVDSTNDYLKQYAEHGQPRIAQAREQTAGRGRQDRQWLSSRDQGIYLSFLFYPKWSSRLAPILNAVGVLAVLESLREVVSPDTVVCPKLPNDVLCNGKKVAGILVELSTLGSEIKWAIVGIGINVFQTEFPGLHRLEIPPTSLRIEGVIAKSLDQVSQPLISWFAHYLEAAQEGKRSELERRFTQELKAGH